MRRNWAIWVAALALSAGVSAEDGAADPAAAPAPADVAAGDSGGPGIDGPRAMSGMSILGNEEAPKALVIVPWKTSRLGDDPALTGLLDERARPVDREVFLRELSYYALRAGE
jgi:hypothetical protein